jgi:hypothetical protein
MGQSEVRLSGFDWDHGILDADEIRLLQSLYIQAGNNQQKVADRLGPSRWKVKRCLTRSRGLWMPDPVEQTTILAQYRTDLAATNHTIEEQREKDAENEKIIRDMRTELEDKNRQIGDLEFVRRKECADLERGKEKVIQELREAMRQAQQINAAAGGSGGGGDDVEGEVGGAGREREDGSRHRFGEPEGTIGSGIASAGVSHDDRADEG